MIEQKNTTKEKAIVSPELQSQRDYVGNLKDQGFDFSLMIADAFVRGIRDIGYKSTATALDELIDNSIQAEAENIHVLFGFEGSSNKPTQIAVLDDGHGMDPDMIRVSIIWGGTHREGDRSGFGRYGYGLPSASISQGRHFEVISLVNDGQLHKSWLNLQELSNGTYTNEDNRIIVPEPIVVDWPDLLESYINKEYGSDGFRHGTAVVLKQLDRLSWKTKNALEKNLLEHFGITYRNFMREVNIFVNGTRVEPLDPLFTTPGQRYYDLDEDRAKSFEPIKFSVKDKNTGQILGEGKVRFSSMTPRFGSIDKSREAIRGNQNPRFHIMKEHNGIIVMRNGRQIDIITKCPWTTFQNYDRNWGVEIDFPATLDEEFSITTSKQQVVLSDRIWKILEQMNVYKAIETIRGKNLEARSKLKAKQEESGEKRSSEKVMEDAGKFIRKRPGADSEEKLTKREKRFKEEVKKKVELTGLNEEVVERELRAEQEGHPFKVQVESLPGAPFFRVEQVGGQQVLYLNSTHNFYTEVYAGNDSTAYLRAAIEVLLFVIGDCNLDATEEIQLFYTNEIRVWSERLEIALNRLGQFVTANEEIIDEGGFEEESIEDIMEKQPAD